MFTDIPDISKYYKDCNPKIIFFCNFIWSPNIEIIRMALTIYNIDLKTLDMRCQKCCAVLHYANVPSMLFSCNENLERILLSRENEHNVQFDFYPTTHTPYNYINKNSATGFCKIKQMSNTIPHTILNLYINNFIS